MAVKKSNYESPKHKFEFKKGFMDSFDVLVKTYSDALAALNKAATGKEFKSEYGICASAYNMRYVTPSNISTYIGNLIKGIKSGLFKDRIGDVEIFTVESVKRFMTENGCEPFDDDAQVGDDHSTVTPKEMTLNDLIIQCENNIPQNCVYSKGEAAVRGELMQKDLKKINDMHFAANIKKITNSIPSILEKSDDGPGILGTPAYLMIFERFLEELMLAACSINIICVLNMYAYIHPSVEYTRTDVNGEVVTEAYMCKTNDYMIRSRIPFNCNLRDVALQDVTPDFKDLHDAVHFIMKDARSPIAFLVNKYATEDINMHCGDCELVARMFVGGNHHCFNHDNTTMLKDGRVTATSNPNVDVADFETSTGWLDTITFGNNYLDGNYRRDAVGNNKVHPIMNTLDMIYKMFSGCEYKTNEELANNILRNVCLMKGIIHNYRDGKPLENYDLTKDVLVLVGEIITRNMLRLYYNNTPVVSYTDDMTNAGPMPIVTMEEFVMEAETVNQQTGTGNNMAAKVGAVKGETRIDVGNQTTNANKAAQTNGVKGFIDKLVKWLKTELAKFSGNFDKLYGKYIEEVKKNDKTNQEIKAIIGTGKGFDPKINGPHFHLKYDIYGEPVTDVSTLIKDGKVDGNMAACRFMGIPEAKATELLKTAQNTTDEKAKADAAAKSLVEYMLYGGTTPEEYKNQPITGEIWENDIVGELLHISEFVKKLQDNLTSNIEKGSKALEEYSKKVDAEQDANKKTAMTTNLKALQNALQVAGATNTKNVLISLGNKYFFEKYNTYKAIVNAYTQSHNTNATNADTTGAAQIPAAQQTAVANANQPK